MNYRSVNDLTRMVLNNLDKIPCDIDLIVGVPRSGMLLASYISLMLNKPLADIDGYMKNSIMQTGYTKNTSDLVKDIDECRKVLIVEDSVLSGKSIMECKKKIEKISRDVDHIFLAAYVLHSSKDLVDIYFEIVDAPRLFEWNVFHQPSALKKMCFDIDGVLCVDPTSEQNDDGEKYRNFILNAPTKIIPKGKIGYIITSRLEKNRNETEQWLKGNGIEYEELIMLNATAEERTKNNLHVSFKAQEYSKCGAILFVESETRQAYQINQRTKKPVLCIENNTYYDGGIKYKIQYESFSRIKGFLRRFKIIRYIYSLVRKK